jgi:hypothetical protein
MIMPCLKILKLLKIVKVGNRIKPETDRKRKLNCFDTFFVNDAAILKTF